MIRFASLDYNLTPFGRNAVCVGYARLIIIMNTEKMRSIPVVVHLNIHKIGFHVKFPANLSLELELDKKNTCIVEGVTLGKDAIVVNKESHFETTLSYHESTKVYENKKANILICIKTKTSDNKLTAGVVPIQLSSPNQRLANVTAKPLRCNDPKAFIEYSLRMEIIRKGVNSDKFLPPHSGEMQESKRTIFKSAVHYNNNFIEQEDPEIQSRGNQLEKYLSAANKNDSRKRYKSSGKLPVISMQNCQDDSRTEIISYRKEYPNDCSIVSSRHSIEKQVKELSKRSQLLAKEINEYRVIQKNLKNQNKELKSKICKYQQQIDQKSSQIANLTKRYEVRQSSSLQEMKQMRNKLSQTEEQLHQLLMEKNFSLNQMQSKEKEVFTVLKEKEKLLAEERRKHSIQLQLKRQQKEKLINENKQLEESLSHSQKMVTDLMVETEKKQKQCQTLKKALEEIKLEMLDKTNKLNGLRSEVVDKGKAVDDLKVQKKLIYEIKYERDQKEIALNQSAAQIKELQLALAQKDELIRSKSMALQTINKEKESLQDFLKQQTAKQAELVKKIKQYEIQVKRSADNSSKISKQIKQVESELKGIKQHASSEASEKTKLVGDYEQYIASLQQKVETLIQQKNVEERAYANLSNIFKQKQDELFDLGQQLIISKQQIANLSNQIQLLREENLYMTKSIQELTEKEERLMKAEQQLQYKERLYQQFEQKNQLQRIQFENQIKILEQRIEEKNEALQNLNEHLLKAERQQVDLQDQIQTLRISLANRTSELNFLKMESNRNRQSTINFEQKMALLRKTEENATSTVEELREQNQALRKMISENEQAITTLGKRYDTLSRSTVQSLTQLIALLHSQKSIMNASLRHEKQEVTILLNDCIRYIAAQRENASIQMGKLSKSLQEETAANKQNLKIIRLKSQMQKQLEDEMKVMKAFEESLQANIVNLNKNNENHLQNIKQKQSIISGLNADIVTLRKQHANQITKKEQIIQEKEKQIDRLNHQIELDAQKYNANIQKIKLTMANMQADLQSKITSLNQTIAKLQSDLKSQRETSRQQRLKINELQSTISKLNRQKQQVSSELEKRTNELIAARLQSENKSKNILEKQAQIVNLEKSIEKLNNNINILQSKLQKNQQNYKDILVKKTEVETLLKQKNNQILAMKIRIDQIEDVKAKLAQQKQDLMKNKGNQQELITNLNRTVKQLKDSIISSEDKIKKLTYQRQLADKENSKKLNIMTNQKLTLERQLSELKLKANQRQTEFASKEKVLQDQLKASKAKIGENLSIIADLRKQIEAGNNKMNNLLNDFNSKAAQLQSKEKSMLPSASKLKEVIQSINQLKTIAKQYQTSKGKLLRLTKSTMLDQRNFQKMCEVGRQLGIAINKVKIQILNKLNLSTEVKTALLQGLKNVQLVVQRLNKN